MLHLTNEQLKAINATFGKYVVFAGAGSGKTRVLVERTARLIKENYAKDEEIMLITYTNKAANEIKQRLTILLNREHKVVVTTFHAYCFKIILEFYPENRKKKVKVLDDDSKRAILKDLIEKLDLKLETGESARVISAIKNKVKLKINNISEILRYIRLFKEYNKVCNDNDYLDFDEMLVQYFNVLESNEDVLEIESSQFKFIMVDECQDINQLQMDVLDKLSYVHNNIMLVGDLDQAIYKWRGSDSDLIKSLVLRKGVNTLYLSYNFRSDGNIVCLAEDLIKHNQNRIYKQMNPIKPKEVLIDYKQFSDKLSEAKYISKQIKIYHYMGIPYKEMFCLVRVKRNTTPLELEFMEQDIPYLIDGISVSDRKEISLLLKYLDFLINPNDDRSFLSIVNEPARGIGAARLNEIINVSAFNNISYYEAAKTLNDKFVKAFVDTIEELLILINNTNPKDFIDILIEKIGYVEYVSRLSKHNIRLSRLNTFKDSLLNYVNGDNTKYREFINMFYLSNEKDSTNEDSVRITTIHQAKGLEAECVFIIGCNKEIMPGNVTDIDLVEEERNLMYVAVTRAKRYLHITAPLKDMDGKTCLRPSPFIYELLKRQLDEEKALNTQDLPF